MRTIQLIYDGVSAIFKYRVQYTAGADEGTNCLLYILLILYGKHINQNMLACILSMNLSIQK